MIARLARRFVIVILVWAMPKVPHDQLRQAFDKRFSHQDDDWRQAVWREAADRLASKAHA